MEATQKTERKVNGPTALPAAEQVVNGKTPDLKLNPDEQRLLMNCNTVAINAKARIYDLQANLEVARGQLKEAQDTFNGALAGVARSRDIRENVGVKEDFSEIVIIPQQQQQMPR
jgi:hypothetical protein